MPETKINEVPIQVPAENLSESALAGIVENFILREGTDYGSVEASFETKAKQIRRQIEKGDIKIVFDQASETVSLLTARDYARLVRGSSQ